MENQASSTILSIPHGGGAIQGIGEKFSADLHTGTGNFEIPVRLPPGRNGFQPQLSLIYSTGNGNGPYGLGWTSSLQGISRGTTKGVPKYEDSTDVFLLSGTEDLVSLGEPFGSMNYRPRTDTLFARITHHQDSANDYWDVRSKDGLQYLYGTPAKLGSDSATVTDPSDPTKIFSWKLTKTLDPFGNLVEYEYERDQGEEGPRDWDQLYIKEIRYVNYKDGNQDRFLVSVIFQYEFRFDAFSDYRAGFEIRTRKRCKRIEIRSHAENERLLVSYDFVYLDSQKDLAQPLPLNGVSLLSQLKIVGHDGERSEELPPFEFAYTTFDPEKRTFFPVQGDELPTSSLSSPTLDMVDLFGNGLPDILEMNEGIRYWRNLGQGKFDMPREMHDAPGGIRLGESGVQLIDMNGDGRIDLLVMTGNLAGYFPMRFGGLWDQNSFQRFDTVPSFEFDDPELRLIDLDGDGVTDAIRSGTRLECFFNDSKEGWVGTRFVERRALEEFPDVNFSDPRVKWADFSGDGFQDIALVYDGNVEYWPNLGNGNWGKRISFSKSPRFPEGYDPNRILLGDVDGDGLADLVYVDHNRVLLWINQNGNQWSDPIEIDGTPDITDTDAVRLIDLLGSGVSGVLWSFPAIGFGEPSMFFLDFTGARKPYLLNELNNHLGAVTKVEYASSTEYYLRDEKEADTRWKTTLPFPVLVVSRVEVVDEISGGKLTTEYSYHHGYWDGAEREFRGFARVDQRDTESFTSYHSSALAGTQNIKPVSPEAFVAPLEIRNWFHQGPIGDEFGDWQETDFSAEFWTEDPQFLSRPPDVKSLLKNLPRRARRDALRALRGSTLRTELYSLDGTELEDRPYTVIENLFGVREESPPTEDEDRLHIFFPHLLAQRVTRWDRGAEPLTRFTFTEDYDAYGQSRLEIEIGVPRWRRINFESFPPNVDLLDHSDEPAQYLIKFFKKKFAIPNDPAQFLVDRVAEIRSYELKDDPASWKWARRAITEIRERIETGNLEGADVLIGHTLNFYDGTVFEGLPAGIVGPFGMLVRTEVLTLTDEILQEAYKSNGTVNSPPEIPPYLASIGSPLWSEEYPLQFRNSLPALGGFHYHTEAPYFAGYYSATIRQKFDFHEGEGNGLVIVSRDPLGNDTQIKYDSFKLLPTEVIDPAGMITTAVNSYSSFQISLLTDPNGNRTLFTQTPLGNLENITLMGKEGELAGDLPDQPTTHYEYDFFAFLNRGQPISVRTIRRFHHVHDADVPLPDRNETLESIEYSDGFGRLLQLRTQAEEVIWGDPVFGNQVLPSSQNDQPGTQADVVGNTDQQQRVVVSGWQIYNNKGWVVEKYEPFFAAGWEYAAPTEQEFGSRMRMFYDPYGEVIRTVNSDGSQQSVVYGVPLDIEKPEQYEPTPWEVYSYDENDNAARTHAAESQAYQNHWNTPMSVVIDAYGRTIKRIERNGSDPLKDWCVTRMFYDIRGNLLSVVDAVGHVAANYKYDLVNNTLRSENIDAGIRRIVRDAADNEIERRDSKGSILLFAYDLLNRPVRLWGTDSFHQKTTLRERLIYGDDPQSGLTPNEARSANLLSRDFQHFDQAGLITFESYDFKGNPTEKVRRVISDKSLLSPFEQPPPDWQISPFSIDWEPPAGLTLTDYATGQLDSSEYRTTASYDALNRSKFVLFPTDADAGRKELRSYYSRSGALRKVNLDGKTYVEQIAYNAKGDRTLIAYGNGVMTRYAYDAKDFRLRRLRSERYILTAPFTYRPEGVPLQDFAYRYDLFGNMISIQDRTPESGILNTSLGAHALDRQFTYDPLYRLLSASGREYDIQPDHPPWIDSVKPQDATKTRGYLETYRYDPIDNIQELNHQSSSASFVRHFSLAPGKNQLKTLSIGQADFQYSYDANGNLTDETTSRHFEWDCKDQMKVFRVQTQNAQPSIYVHYLYDLNGKRTKKLVRKQNGDYETIVYIDSVFEEHRWKGADDSEVKNNHIHILDDEQRIALIRIGEAHPDDPGPAIQYHLGDFVGSNNAVIDESGTWVNREEFTPFGETSFGGFARKRYRFIGKERDEESGLYDLGARHYAPWLGRWTAADPQLFADGMNPYCYVGNKPESLIDATGVNGTAPANPKRSRKPLADLKRRSGPGGADEWKTPKHIRGWLKNEQRRTKSRSPYKWRNPPGHQGGHPYDKPFVTHGDRGGPMKWEFDYDNNRKDKIRQGFKPSEPHSPIPGKSPKEVAEELAQQSKKVAKAAEAGDGLAKKIANLAGDKAKKFAPGIGIVFGLYQGIDNLQQGNYVEGVLDLLGAIPGPIGDVADGIGIAYSIGKLVVEELAEPSGQDGQGQQGEKPEEGEVQKLQKMPKIEIPKIKMPKPAPKPEPPPPPPEPEPEPKKPKVLIDVC